MIKNLLKAFKRPFSKPYIAKDGEFDALVAKYDVPEYKVKCHYIYCCVRYGCMPFQYVVFDFYGKRHIARRSFVTEAENYSRFAKIMNPILSKSENDNVFTNKAEFNRLFDKYIGRDWILICRGGGTEEQEFIRFLRNHNKVIVKPLKGNGGHGIEVLCTSDYINENDVIRKYKELISHDDYIVEQILTQCDEFSNLNPSSINTVRVVAARDRKNIIHIVGAQLRIGKPGAIVDNFSSGGIMYPLDVKYGFVNGKGYDREGNTYAVHPGTNFPILGFQVPRFDNLIQLVENAMQVIPSERWVGWDVCVSKDQFCIVEGNLGPGCETYQLDQVGKRKELIEYSK